MVATQTKYEAKVFNPIHKSIGARLFVYVLSGTLVGLGSMSYLFYQILENQAKQEIQRHLSIKVKSVEVELTEIQRSTLNLAAAIKTFDEFKIRDLEAFKKLVFSFYKQKSSLNSGVGASQTSQYF